MKISQLIRELLQVKAEYGDIEICREDGKPFTFIALDKVHPLNPTKLIEVDRKELSK